MISTVYNPGYAVLNTLGQIVQRFDNPLVAHDYAEANGDLVVRKFATDPVGWPIPQISFQIMDHAEQVVSGSTWQDVGLAPCGCHVYARQDFFGISYEIMHYSHCKER